MRATERVIILSLESGTVMFIGEHLKTRACTVLFSVSQDCVSDKQVDSLMPFVRASRSCHSCPESFCTKTYCVPAISTFWNRSKRAIPITCPPAESECCDRGERLVEVDSKDAFNHQTT